MIFVEYHRRSLPWFYVRAMIYSEPSLAVQCKLLQEELDFWKRRSIRLESYSRKEILKYLMSRKLPMKTQKLLSRSF